MDRKFEDSFLGKKYTFSMDFVRSTSFILSIFIAMLRRTTVCEILLLILARSCVKSSDNSSLLNYYGMILSFLFLFSSLA